MHRLVLDDGQVVRGRTVLIATGATYQRLPVAGCERWDGAGIFYSCTSVHARSCRSGRAAVVGGGNSAGQAVMFLAEHTAGATLLLRGGDLRKSMSDYLARRIERHPKIEVIRHVEVDAVEGDRTITGLRLRDVRDGEFPRPRLLGGIRLHRRAAQDRLDAPEHRRRFQGLHPHRGRCREIRPLAPDGPRALHRSRPRARGSSPRETSAAARPNGSRLPSATGPWRSPARTGCSRRFEATW